ncbi:MAG: arsenite methyltransferase [Planctomycetes bacterium]|nr:arsenite methyltransferase [Planctomycetota bacterium]
MNQPTEPTSQAANDQIRAAVRERYAAASSSGGCGCAPAATGCCGAPVSADEVAQALGYSQEQTGAVPAGANLGLGCGNPTAIASLQLGQTVLDLGSGAGFDAFLAARAVGPSGRVIGVDMTPEMLAKARQNRAQGNWQNVDFRLGEIENLPVADRSVDVVISNCVINLSPDKSRVLAETFRVLRPGGRIAVSDIVALRPIPEAMKADFALYTGCVAGAATIDALRTMLTNVGFTDIRIEPKTELREVVDGWFPERGIGDVVASANITAVRPSGA